MILVKDGKGKKSLLLSKNTSKHYLKLHVKWHDPKPLISEAVSHLSEIILYVKLILYLQYVITINKKVF